MTKPAIINILIRRDGMSKAEAIELVKATQTDIDSALDNSAYLWQAEEIIYENLGLEPDYLMAFC